MDDLLYPEAQIKGKQGLDHCLCVNHIFVVLVNVIKCSFHPLFIPTYPFLGHRLLEPILANTERKAVILPKTVCSHCLYSHLLFKNDKLGKMHFNGINSINLELLYIHCS